jgi:hypothetical protein
MSGASYPRSRCQSWRHGCRAGLYADGYTGRARMFVDNDRGYLLGVTLVGPGWKSSSTRPPLPWPARSRSAACGKDGGHPHRATHCEPVRTSRSGIPPTQLQLDLGIERRSARSAMSTGKRKPPIAGDHRFIKNGA